MSKDIAEMLTTLINPPEKNQIQIDFDLNKRIFILSVPIYSTQFFLPSSVINYVKSRNNYSFKPHSTSFHLNEEKTVTLVQEIPFDWGFQPTLRDQVDHFWHLSKKCHQILSEIAIEEKYQAALYLCNEAGPESELI
jgi:hypothetical protein